VKVKQLHLFNKEEAGLVLADVLKFDKSQEGMLKL
jgi:hypothetical protein